MLFYSAVGIAASAVLFFGIHAFARPPPRTMTKEWQEATNEYLRVRHTTAPAMSYLTLVGREIQPYLRYQQRGILRQGPCSEQACKGSRYHLGSRRIDGIGRNMRCLGRYALHCTVAISRDGSSSLCKYTCYCGSPAPKSNPMDVYSVLLLAQSSIPASSEIMISQPRGAPLSLALCRYFPCT